MARFRFGRCPDQSNSLGLNEDEVDLYDASGFNDNAAHALSGDTLKLIAQELVELVKRSISVDWTKRENARAQIRVKVKPILRRYGYPPGMQAKATELVLEQSTVLCTEWAAE